MSVSHLSLMQVAASAFLLRSSLPSHQILLPPDTAPTTERAVASSSQRRGLPTPTQPHSRSLPRSSARLRPTSHGRVLPRVDMAVRSSLAVLLPLLLLLLLPSCPVTAARAIHVHNPRGAVVTKIHMVLSSHFDAGCKTPGCGVVHEGEPNKCAKVGAGNAHGATDPFGTGEPWAYHIVNRYFDEFIPKAIDLAEQGRRAGVKYTYMTQSWVLSLYLDCARAGMRSWPGSGHARVGTPVLHCPNASAVADLKAALKRGDIFFHGFSSDNEASYYPDASLFEAAITVGERISDELGIARPVAVSQRDVPGWTRAAIPLLHKHGIVGLSFGAGTPPGKVDVPPLSVWEDKPSGTSVVLTYETGYGQDSTLFVLPNGEALCVVSSRYASPLRSELEL
jgi:hypothetical protein